MFRPLEQSCWSTKVTKYDPSFRNPSGAYLRNEWTSASDIGRSFDGAVLTPEEYRREEDAYVAVALRFVRESGQTSLAVCGLENKRRCQLGFAEGSPLGLDELGSVIRRVLREECWCRLEGPAGFLHFGWDYYMYVGVPRPCPESQELAKRVGLFVEECPSPYKQGASA
jgi:hypothetical protein